ncbi:hypothetical protein CW751_10070 [Brumimicrobium salinarum]|uniref:Bile acid:sodium symporter n=1 Tax=Brumimicrobium salinarum TaxID=2058658 RepID=A0A2I0R1G1_9FLAO|nr:bile acid:sodium symporter [Brumimicrobium salinarum]PKR80406.1 hypothetical protein CW751_10070 [Brumimicrobium salinarum]
MLETFKEVGLTVFLPVIIGMITRNYFPITVKKIRKPLRFILPAIMFLVFTLVLLNENGNGGKSLMEYKDLILPALCLNVLVMFVGYYLSGLIGINHKGKYTIAIEMGLQNSALAIFLANNVIQIESLSLIAVLYGGFSFFSTFLIAWGMKRLGKKDALPQDL